MEGGESGIPVTINKNDGASILTINNFSNVYVDANNHSDILSNLGGDEKDAILVKTLGPTMQISFDYIILDESSTVVTGSTITNARDQLKWLYNTLMSTGQNQHRDSYQVVLQYSTTPLDSGTTSAGASTTLTDGSKSWTTNQYANQVVKITGGTGLGQVRTILSNTATTLTISARPEDNWTTNPDNTSTYQILDAFERKGFLSKITCQTASDQPLSWRGNMQFQVGTVT